MSVQRYNLRPMIDGDNVMDWPRDLRHGPNVVLATDYDALLRERDEAAALLRECRHFVKALCDHDDATCGCYQHIVLRGIDAFLAKVKP